MSPGTGRGLLPQLSRVHSDGHMLAARFSELSWATGEKDTRKTLTIVTVSHWVQTQPLGSHWEIRGAAGFGAEARGGAHANQCHFVHLQTFLRTVAKVLLLPSWTHVSEVREEHISILPGNPHLSERPGVA